MRTNSILILALVLIVLVVLFNNNKQEPFHSEYKYEVNIENIVNELEVILFLLTNSQDCQKFKNASDDQNREILGIPKHIKVTKILHIGAGDIESLPAFIKHGILNIPKVVIHHPYTGLFKSVDASKEAVSLAVGNVVEQVKAYASKAQ
jgi:hypothetical protein